MTDFLLLKKITELSRSEPRPRVFHENSAGAYGFFRPYMSMGDLTRADFLSDSEKETRVFVRFSKSVGTGDSPEISRDIRGFSTKFFCEDGVYDLICQHLPVYYIKDPSKIPSLFDALMPPKNKKYAEEERLWKFAVRNSESMNLILRLFSAEGYVADYTAMDGYSVNTYKWVDKRGESFYVRYRWKAAKTGKAITAQEAEFMAGFAPHCGSTELCNAIEAGEFPSYEMQIQLMSERERKEAEFDIFAKTILWPEQRYPYLKIGRLTLTENPTDYKQEVRQTGFSPGNLVDGIELPDDEFLKYMVFAHDLAQQERGAE